MTLNDSFDEVFPRVYEPGSIDCSGEIRATFFQHSILFSSSYCSLASRVKQVWRQYASLSNSLQNWPLWNYLIYRIRSVLLLVARREGCVVLLSGAHGHPFPWRRISIGGCVRRSQRLCSSQWNRARPGFYLSLHASMIHVRLTFWFRYPLLSLNSPSPFAFSLSRNVAIPFIL